MAYCRKCRTRIDDEAVICPHCGVRQQESAFCRKCGKRIDEEAVICPHCGVPQQENGAKSVDERKALVSEIFLSILIPIIGIIIGAVYMGTGKPKAGETMIAVGVLTGVIAGVIIYIMTSMPA